MEEDGRNQLEHEVMPLWEEIEHAAGPALANVLLAFRSKLPPDRAFPRGRSVLRCAANTAPEFSSARWVAAKTLLMDRTEDIDTRLMYLFSEIRKPPAEIRFDGDPDGLFEARRTLDAAVAKLAHLCQSSGTPSCVLMQYPQAQDAGGFSLHDHSAFSVARAQLAREFPKYALVCAVATLDAADLDSAEDLRSALETRRVPEDGPFGREHACSLLLRTQEMQAGDASSRDPEQRPSPKRTTNMELSETSSSEENSSDDDLE